MEPYGANGTQGPQGFQTDTSTDLTLRIKFSLQCLKCADLAIIQCGGNRHQVEAFLSL